MMAAISPTNATCNAMPRSRGSRHGAGRLGCSPIPAGSLATAVPPSADPHRVDQPALGPQIVVAALQLERRAEAEMLVEDLAVIADQLDRVVGPFLVDPQGLAHAWCRTE